MDSGLAASRRCGNDEFGAADDMTKRSKSRVNPILFVRLADGTVLRQRKDGSFRPVKDKSDLERLAALTDADIERMAQSDPDHRGFEILSEWSSPEDDEAFRDL
jgi:hypothetical protein